MTHLWTDAAPAPPPPAPRGNASAAHLTVGWPGSSASAKWLQTPMVSSVPSAAPAARRRSAPASRQPAHPRDAGRCRRSDAAAPDGPTPDGGGLQPAAPSTARSPTGRSRRPPTGVRSSCGPASHAMIGTSMPAVRSASASAGFGDAEPLRARFERSPRAGQHAVPVAVGFHDRHDGGGAGAAHELGRRRPHRVEVDYRFDAATTAPPTPAAVRAAAQARGSASSRSQRRERRPVRLHGERGRPCPCSHAATLPASSVERPDCQQGPRPVPTARHRCLPTQPADAGAVDPGCAAGIDDERRRPLQQHRRAKLGRRAGARCPAGPRRARP